MSRKEPQPLPEGIIKPPPPPAPPDVVKRAYLVPSPVAILYGRNETRTHRISFCVSAREKAQIDDYCQHKKRWRTPSDLARDAVWQMINRNRAGGHRRPKKGPE